MKLINFQDAAVHFRYLHEFPQEDTSYIMHGKTVAYYSDEEQDCDLQYCYIHDIPTYAIKRPGGTIVAFPGDLTYIHICKEEDHFNLKFLKFLIKKLEERNIKAKIQNNDLTIVGHGKVCGIVSIKIDDYICYAGHITIEPQFNLIKNICMKPINHKIEGLKQFNITSQDIENWFNEFRFRN